MNNGMQTHEFNRTVQPSNIGGAAAASDSNKAIAEIQSAMAIAKRFPRNQMQAIDNIVNAFGRQSLAKVSQYQYSKGGSEVSGPSIRSAEAVAQMWGNIQFGFRELTRGVDERGVGYSEVEAYAWDIESNTKRPTTFIVKHWRDTKSGGYQIKDEREIYELTANMAQRRVRACIIAVIPGDVFDTAMDTATNTLRASADTSPEGIKKMLNAFRHLGIEKSQIESRIQRNIESVQPGQVVQLLRIYQSLKDGMSQPEDWFEFEDDGKKKTRSATPEYPQDRFDKNFPKWKVAIEAGEKTAERIINTLTTEYTLSETQISQIRDVKVKAKEEAQAKPEALPDQPEAEVDMMDDDFLDDY